MLSFFKSSKKKSVRKGKAFYDRENLIQTIDELYVILSLLKSDDSIVTKEPILFQGKELSSINIKNLGELFGDESYILTPENGISDHKVYYYRIKSEHLKFLVQLHFIKNEFFLAGTKVYSDNLLTDNDKLKVIEKIRAKYCPELHSSIYEFKIRDKEGNTLWTQEDVFFHINCLYNNSTCQQLKEQYSGHVKPKPGQEIKNTLDNII